MRFRGSTADPIAQLQGELARMVEAAWDVSGWRKTGAQETREAAEEMLVNRDETFHDDWKEELS